MGGVVTTDDLRGQGRVGKVCKDWRVGTEAVMETLAAAIQQGSLLPLVRLEA